MLVTAKLAATALVSFAVGAGGTYATLHVTATCSLPAMPVRHDDGKLKAFLAPAPLPTNDQPEY